MEICFQMLKVVSSVGSLIGVWFVYIALRANHDWQRREYAMNMGRDWNINTAQHWEAIENVFPHLRDVDRTGGEINRAYKTTGKGNLHE